MIPLYDINPHRRVPWLTLLIIATNIGVMVWLQRLPLQAPGTLDQLSVIARRGFVPQRVQQLSDPQLAVKVRFSAERRPWGPGPGGAGDRTVVLRADRAEIVCSLFSMMFLHGGWLHLAGNMWFLWIFANNIEDRLGHFIFFCFYILGGLLALACHWLANPDSAVPVIGASGAVAAVLGAYAITFPKAKVRTLVFLGIILVLDLPALLVLGIWLALQMVQGAGMLNLGMQDTVAWWAHVGGFMAGMALMPLLTLGAAAVGEDWQREADDAFR